MNLLFVDGLLLPPIQTVMTWGWFIWFYYIKIHYHPLPSTKTHCGKALFPTGRSHRVGVWVPHSAGHCSRWSCRCSCQAKHRPRPGSFGSSGLRRIFWNTLTCFFGISLEALEISWDILSCYILLVLAFFGWKTWQTFCQLYVPHRSSGHGWCAPMKATAALRSPGLLEPRIRAVRPRRRTEMDWNVVLTPGWEIMQYDVRWCNMM